MSRLRMRISMSLDGYVAGPDQSVDNPLGIGGMQLHEWAFALAVWQEEHGRPGQGEVNASTAVYEEAYANTGATIMGRNMFGGGPGPWNEDEPWNGWWGDEPPFHHPVFVLTTHPREPLTMGETTFTFVTDGIESALDQAKAAAGGQDVSLGGGGSTCDAYLAAGLVDEMLIHLVPVILGGGSRLFAAPGVELNGLELVDTVTAPGVVHLKFAR